MLPSLHYRAAFSRKLLVLREHLGSIIFDDLSLVQDKDLVEVGNGTQPVGHHEQGAIAKFLTYSALYQSICVHINRTRCLVED